MKTTVIIMSLLSLVVLFAAHAQTISVRPAEALAKRSECLKCHAGIGSKKPVGPTFSQIAARYKNNLQMADSLIAIIKNGSKGSWTEISKGVPMPPYSGRLTDAEIRSLADWILNN